MGTYLLRHGVLVVITGWGGLGAHGSRRHLAGFLRPLPWNHSGYRGGTGAAARAAEHAASDARAWFRCWTSTELGGHLTHVRGVLHEEVEVCGWEGRPARARGKSVRWVSADLRVGDFR